MPLAARATELKDVIVVEPVRHSDERGWFTQSWSAKEFAEIGIETAFVQENHSYSRHRNTLRGLHFQAPPFAQDKLVRCTSGRLLDVVVDARRGSSTFGAWVSVELTAQNGRQIFVPQGFLHGFLTLSDHTEVQYKVSADYAPEADGSVRWDSFGIDWGTQRPILSQKDATAPSFENWTSPFHAEVAA